MIGRKLAHYEITAKIGEGGMGQVFRALDGKLGREVALKVLPKEMSGDVERALRFAREARTLASLQHANIASVYGYEEIDGVRFLVMELVEGEDLQKRLARGAIPLDEALDIASQIAAGLEAAHDQGIIHRDLKPANVKLSPTGEVKVLDFGLARAYLGDPTDASDINNSPTITAAMTGAGVILGTAAYMSPEQARGKLLDARTDLWAFGVVLFEMLTGQRLFAGETVSDTLAAVLRAEPDMGALPAETPPSVHRLLRRCLQRDPKLRMRSAGDAILDLLEQEQIAEESTTVVGRPRLLWGLVAILAAALTFSIFARSGTSDLGAEAFHLDIAAPDNMSIHVVPPALSPDGRWLAFVAVDSAGRRQLQLRSSARHETETLSDPQIQALGIPNFLFWSPDSHHLGIQSGGDLVSLDIDSRSFQNIHSLHEAPGFGRGATWSVHGEILFAPNSNSGIMSISRDGGTARAITVIDTALADASHRWPTFLPDGRRFVFTTWSNSTKEREAIGGIYAASLDGGEPVRLLEDASMAVFDPAGSLLFHRGGKLMCVEFDIEAAEIRGRPTLVAGEVSWDPNNGLIMATVSAGGNLVYSASELRQEHTLGWAGIDGSFDRLMDVNSYLFDIKLSPNNRFAALELITAESSVDVWIADLERRTLSRLSRFDSDSHSGRFSADGLRFTYSNQSPGSKHIYLQGIDGATKPELLLDVKALSLDITHWTADGNLLFYDHLIRRSNNSQVNVLDLSTGETQTLLTDDFWQGEAVLSPDGQWLAYTSGESGRREIYLRPFPAFNRKWQISIDGGSWPGWRDDGAALVYVTAIGDYLAVDISVKDGEIEASAPRLLRSWGPEYAAVTIDTAHERFLVARRKHRRAPMPLRFISNWRSEIDAQPR